MIEQNASPRRLPTNGGRSQHRGKPRQLVDSQCALTNERAVRSRWYAHAQTVPSRGNRAFECQVRGEGPSRLEPVRT